MVELEPSGERMIMEEYQSSAEDHLIYLMHMATYRFAMRFTAGKKVLDYGCGSGYGSSLIAEHAVQVTGVDVAEDAVAFAKHRFRADNLAFCTVPADGALPFGTASFDTVLSFQVFEHVEHEQLYLGEIARVLTPGGTLVLATPDRSTRLLPGQQPWNRWHLREHSDNSLRATLSQRFATVEMLHMSGEPKVIEIELKRCARVKWITLPFTLPFYPRALRVALLNMIHRLRGRPAKPSAKRQYDFDESAIVIGAGLVPSLNLVAVARTDTRT
jgi:SAM-dependent methyltransferase